MPKKKKKKISPPSIQFIYPGDCSKTYYINELPFDEHQVVKGSIMFFDDPEPCMIHKSAVISRYVDEIHQWLQNVEMSCEHDISCFPEDLREKIDSAAVRDAQCFKILMEEISED